MLKSIRLTVALCITGLMLSLITPGFVHADLFVLGAVWSGTFTTYNSSGALTNADSTPSCQSFIGSSSTAVNTGSTTNISTGLYRYQITMSAGNGFAAGNAYSNLCTAVLGGVTQVVHKQDGIYLLATPGTAGVLSVDVGRWLNSVPNGLTAGRVDTTVGAMQTDVVTAAAVAANSIDASALATDAVTEIQTNLLTFPKGVALANYGFYLSKAGVDYNTGTNATITCERIQDAGTFANCDAASQSSITFKAKGVYNMTIAATDMNANKVWIRLYVTADPLVNVWQQQLIPGH